MQLFAMNRDIKRSLDAFERFCQKHQRVVGALRNIYGIDRKDFPIPDFVALVRFASVFGIEDGVNRFVGLRNLGPSVEDAFKQILAVTGGIPTLDEAKAFAEYRERKLGITVSRNDQRMPRK